MAIFAVLSAAIGSFIIIKVNPRSGVPVYSSLAEASGRLAWTQPFRYGTRFGLVGVPQNFDYPSKARGMGAVRDSLAAAGTSVVSVKYETSEHGPIYSDKKYHLVWELSIGGHPVRTYEQTLDGWQGDNRLAPWLGAALLSCGLYLGYISWKSRRAA